MATTNYDLNKDFVENVRQASDIVQIIGQQVNLRKRGSNFLGLCPFHKEKTPSFTVSADKQMFYCFGCGASGDIFSFLQQHEGLSFPESVVELAKSAGLTIPERTVQNKQKQLQRQDLLEVCEAAASYFNKQLNAKSGTNVREYLSERGLSPETIEKYTIGFAPDGYENLLSALQKEFGSETLERAGLVQKSQKKAGYYDRFRNRVMIPIRNTSGDIIAFGGRIFGEGEPKYLNSPETSLFHKSKVLFGLYEGYRSLRKMGYAILVEGYFDAIMLHQHGFPNTIAPLGTAFGEGHTAIIKRYCSKAVLAMDSDTAGKNAALKTAAILLNAGFAVNITSMPDGEDPDSLVNSLGHDGFKEYLQKSSSVTRFAVTRSQQQFDTSRAGGKRDALEELLPILSAFSDPLQRSEAITLVGQELQIPEHTIVSALRSMRRAPEAERQRKPEIALITQSEHELIKSAVQNPTISKKAVEDYQIIDYVTSFARSLLSALWERKTADEKLDSKKLIAVAQNEAEKHFITQLIISDKDAETIEATECVRGIAIDHKKKQIQAINRQIQSLEQEGASGKKVDTLYADKLKISSEILSLEGELP